jgi:hypothetical protein
VGPRQGGLLGPPLPSAGPRQRGLGTPLPSVGLLPLEGPRQRGPMGLGPPLPLAGPQQFRAVTARPPLQQRTCASRWGRPLQRTKCPSPIGVARLVYRGGGGGSVLILQTRPRLGFRRGAGGQVRVRMN